MIDILTPSVIAAFPMTPPFERNEINRLCREGEIWAYKDPNKKIAAQWLIPVGSFALYLKQHTYLAMQFNQMDTTLLGGDILMAFEAVKKFLTRSGTSMDKAYTIDRLSMIFDVPKTTVATWFGYSKVMATLFHGMGGHTIPFNDIVTFLDENQERLKALCDRHTALLKTPTNAYVENEVRHLLVLYSYTKLE